MLSWIVLVVALYIALAIVIPPFQAPLHAIGLELPSLTRYQISGIVRELGTNKPIESVRVNVGGYSGVTDSAGRYEFSFSSSSSQRIAVVMDNAGSSTVYLVDAGPDNKVVLDESLK